MKKYILTIKELNIALQQQQPFHLVDPSPWPILTAFSTLGLTTGGVMYMHSFSGGGFLATFSFVVLVAILGLWWQDIVLEATYEGKHTLLVRQGLRYGMLLFITSEVIFFAAFFWAFFHASLVPTIEIGAVWPPASIVPFNPFGIPLLNTFILLSSGVTVTWAHHSIINNAREDSINGLLLTVGLGIIFTIFQAYEYSSASFTISDGIYGSTFFMTTGFHGFHVIIGSIFLLVCAIRNIYYNFSRTHHFGFESAAWYWHFVDVVWLFVFTFIYWWGC